MDGAFVVAEFEGAAGAVDFGPGFAAVGGRVDVFEDCCCHGCAVGEYGCS